MTMNIKKSMSMAVFTVLIFAVLTQSIGHVQAQNDEGDWEVIVDEGENHIHFRFGRTEDDKDAVFGIGWGTADDEGGLHTFSIQNRHVAMTSVYDEDGDPIAENKPIAVQSVLLARLWRIFEHNDSNGNGLCDHIIDEDGRFVQFEKLNKYVDLREADWEASPLIEEKVGDNTTWEFTLSAKDLSYYDVSTLPEKVLYNDTEENKLEFLNFTFHLTASTKIIEGASMPSFRVTVYKGIGPMQRLHEVEREANHEFNGVVGAYAIKWDHEIIGWDFNSDNDNSALFMEFHNIVGTHIPMGMPLWQHRFVRRIGEDMRARYNDDEGEHFSNMTEEPPVRDRKLHQNRISYGGNWSRTGRFNWVSDVIVDGREDEMYAQIVRGRPVVHIGPNKRNFVGFAVYGGFNYPGGKNIYHDPGIDGSSYLDISLETMESERAPFRGLFAGALVAAAALVIMIVVISRKPGDKTHVESGQYDRIRTEKENDWSKYYDRG